MEDLLPVIYNPTMKISCTQLNIVYRRPRGIYITIHDRGHCLDILKNWYVCMIIIYEYSKEKITFRSALSQKLM